jgi:hypothetical protein
MKLLNIATESIAFQTGAFFKEVTLLCQDIRELDARTPQEMAKFFTRIDQCVYKHTGITTSANFWPGADNACVIMPTLTRGNVLHRGEFNEFLKENFDPANVSFLNLEKKGWIDPANSRVGGAFSEIVFKMYIGEMFLLGKAFTSEEAAAAILHEVGHAYTFLQFMADTVVTACVLQRSYAELTNGNPDKKVKFILTKAADDMKMKGREWLEAVTDSTSGEVAYKVLASAVQIEPRAMDNKRYFTMDTAEELADIFAARHGAGRAIVTMRSKFSSVSQTYGILVGLAFSLAGLITVVYNPFSAVFIITGLFFVLNGALMAANAPDLSTYKQLATKMRNQFVEKLKLSKLPKEEVAEQIESINLTDKIIQGYKDDIDPALIVKFFDMFRRGKMDARASRDYTDKLESAAANDLFIRAAQFGAAGK